MPGEAPPGGAPAAACCTVAHSEGDAAGDASPLRPTAGPPSLRRCAKGVGRDGLRLTLPDCFPLSHFPRYNKNHRSPLSWLRTPAATSGNGDLRGERDTFRKVELDRPTCFCDGSGSVVSCSFRLSSRAVSSPPHQSAPAPVSGGTHRGKGLAKGKQKVSQHAAALGKAPVLPGFGTPFTKGHPRPHRKP